MAKEQSSGRIGFGGLLLLIFITLKLTNTIDWSWWWVFAPLWLPFAVIAVILLIAAVVKVLAE